MIVAVVVLLLFGVQQWLRNYIYVHCTLRLISVLINHGIPCIVLYDAAVDRL